MSMSSLSVQRVGVGMDWIKNVPGQRSSRGRLRPSCRQVRAGMSVCRTRGVQRQRGIKHRETPWPCLSGSLFWHQRTEGIDSEPPPRRLTYEHRGCFKVPILLPHFSRCLLKPRFWAAFMLMLTGFFLLCYIVQTK